MTGLFLGPFGLRGRVDFERKKAYDNATLSLRILASAAASRVPLSWAETQNNLGHASQILRERGRAF